MVKRKPKKKKAVAKKKVQRKQGKKRMIKKSRKQRGLKKTKRNRAKVTQEQVDAILKKGAERGFITTAEILHIVPNIENNVEALEHIYDLLKEGGVELKEVREFLQVKSDDRALRWLRLVFNG